MIEIEKYAQAAASTARTPPNSPARRAALEAENAARVAAEQFVKGLVAERDEWKQNAINVLDTDLVLQLGLKQERELADVTRERDELRARLAEIKAQEPVFYYRPINGGLYEGPHWAKSICGKMQREERPGEWVPLFTHPSPAQAVPDGCGACGDGCAKRGSCRLADESPEAAR